MCIRGMRIGIHGWCVVVMLKYKQKLPHGELLSAKVPMLLKVNNNSFELVVMTATAVCYQKCVRERLSKENSNL